MKTERNYIIILVRIVTHLKCCIGKIKERENVIYGLLKGTNNENKMN